MSSTWLRSCWAEGNTCEVECGQRWRIRMNDAALCSYAARMVAYKCGGFQSMVWATKDRLATPSATEMGFRGAKKEPLGWVLERSPERVVGEVWFLVRP